MIKLILFVICFMIYCASEINASCSDLQNPELVGTPSIEQLDARKVKISVSSTSLQNRECADLILIKYWPRNSPSIPYTLKLINAMEMDAEILVEDGVEYTYQVWAIKKSEKAEFQNFKMKVISAILMGKEEIKAKEVVHFSKSSEFMFKTSDPQRRFVYIDPRRDTRIQFYGGSELWSASPFILVCAAGAIVINICISSLMIFMMCQLQKYLRNHQVTIEEFVSLPKGRRPKHPLSIQSSKASRVQFSVAPSTQSSMNFNHQNERVALNIVNEE